MNNARFWLLVVVSLSLGVLSSLAQTTPGPIPAPFNQEPVVVFDETGGTLAGPVHLHLAVYNNGLASISRKTRTGSSAADVKMVSPEAVKALFSALQAAGAGSLPDDRTIATDVPLKTVTFFLAPGPRSGSNTFSYLKAHDSYGRVDSILRRFICTNFPGFVICAL